MNKIFFDKCENILPQLLGNSIDLVLTSPPYADMISYGDVVETIDTKKYTAWFLPIAKQLYRILKPSGSFILNINDNCQNFERNAYVYELIYRLTAETNWKFFDRYTWYKKTTIPHNGNRRLIDRTEYIFHFVKNTKYMATYADRIKVPLAPGAILRKKYDIKIHQDTDKNGLRKLSTKKITRSANNRLPDNVFRFPTNGATSGNAHPAAFHPKLPTFFIDWLTDIGDVVCDPFLGSGTTAAVSRFKNRKYVGIEMNKSYAPIIKEKIRNYSPPVISNKFF